MNNINIYNERMAKAIEDKLWLTKFLDMPTFQNSIVYDFGCADGELIRHIASRYPNIQFVGIDISSEMVNLARRKALFDNESYITVGELARYENYNRNKTSIVIMSSVIHEIFTYERHPKRYLFDCLSYMNADYVFIRDMVVNESINRYPYEDDVKKVLYKSWNDKERDLKYLDQLDDFRAFQGKIEQNQKNLIHFLLKYRYIENWDREVRENYLPLTYNGLIELFDFRYYSIYNKQYILPYFKNKVKEDFDIDVYDKTHINIIFKRRKFDK